MIPKRNSSANTLNHEGAPAFTQSSAMQLYSAVVTSLLNDTFYESENERLLRLRELITQNDPLFVARLAIYAREKMYLRTMPVVLTVELAKHHSGDNLISQTAQRIIQRADEITEMLAYYAFANGRTATKKLNQLSKQLRKGIAEAFNRFDEYQFAKYDRKGAVTLRDALFIVHPKPKNEAQQALFNKIAEQTLETPYTWETELSALGQIPFENQKARAEAFRVKWQELIDSGRLGYMALLRNLRNILEAGVSLDHIEKVAARLSDPKEVAKAKQFPFRFFSAYKEISAGKTDTGILKQLRFSQDDSQKARKIVLKALEAACYQSGANIAGFKEETRVLIACDVSGSMQANVSKNSVVQYYDIGLLLGMLLKSRCKNATVGFFGDRWKIVDLPTEKVLKNTMELRSREGEVGYSTNAYLVIEDLIKRKAVMDKIFFFTDCQMWNSKHGNDNALIQNWKRYKEKVAPNAKVYFFDLTGHGNTPLDLQGNDVYLIAGWSDKVFDVLEALDHAEDALKKITEIEI